MLDIEVDIEVFTRLEAAGYFLESVAFFALNLYLLTDNGAAFTGFFVLDDTGVDGIEDIDAVEGTVDIDADEDDFLGAANGALINGYFSNFLSY